MKKQLTIVFLCALLCICLLAACTPEGESTSGKQDKLVLKNSEVSVQIDINATTYVSVALPDLIVDAPQDALYTVTCESDALQISRVTEAGAVNIISNGTLGDYSVNVSVTAANKEELKFQIAVKVVDLAPQPSVKAEIPDVTLDAPMFADDANKTNLTYTMDLSQYFDAIDNATFEMECDEQTATMSCDQAKPWLVTFNFKKLGEKTVTVHVLKDGQRKTSDTFTVTLNGKAPAQMINGNFESGFTGWDLDNWGYAAYDVINDPVDIWGNGIDADGSYLFGYKDEAGTCEFKSSLFKLEGSGMLTWKMAGNCTEDLQFVLMQYNPDGEDVEIAKFNNWYYGTYAGSGFIFRQYCYQVDMQTYGDSLCYFIVKDNLTEEFAFVNLDSIVTYYETAPDVSAMYKAGFCTNPDGMSLDYSDTSKDAFPEDLSTVGNQLANGDFENGYTGWYMTTEEKNAYAINGSNTDIWNNPVGNTNNYLYGFAQENFATANFHSGLFKVGGSGVITWKMAGNSTEDLQFVLMKYNPDGEDEVIAAFNNWYFPISQESGFIFRSYYYQIDMARYEGAYCYFVVKDYRNSDFGFICLDDIVTYYETAPATDGLFKAGFCTAPEE